MIGTETAIHFSGVEKGDACTIVLRGTSKHVLEEAERSIHDALCVLVGTIEDARVLYGGGFTEFQLATVLEKAALKASGKKSLILKSFAKALMCIPTILCDNAGLDTPSIIGTLIAAH